MKITISDELYDYKITITAEMISPFGDKIGGTKEVLSHFETMIWDAWHWRSERKLDALADEAYETAKSLHEILKQKGYYKEVKDNETK